MTEKHGVKGVSRYKPGDTVIINSIKKLSGKSFPCNCGPCRFAHGMEEYCGKTAKIVAYKEYADGDLRYSLDIDSGIYSWIDAFFKGRAI